MGQRGPAAASSAILKLRGDRERKPPATAPGAKCPRCPKQLDKPARAVWRRVAKLAWELGTLTEESADTLARYCRLRVQWDVAMEWIEARGFSFPLLENGKPKCFLQYPQVGAANKLSVELLKLEREFGLTPASRQAMGLDAPKREDDQVASRSRERSA